MMIKKMGAYLGMTSLVACLGFSAHAELNKNIIVIGHRGASALRPEHTLASYQQAMDDGADFIEPDLVATKDGVLVARHENEIGGTTNISTLPQFKDKQTTKVIDGKTIQGWFTEDLTFKELQQVKARERIPKIRPQNTQYNDQYNIPTLDQIIDLAEENYKKTGKVVGLYIETKHPTYFQQQHLALEDRLLKTLSQHQYSQKIAPIYLQSFEVSNLKYMRQKIKQYGLEHVLLIQLYDEPNMQPADIVVQGKKMTYADMATAQGLKQVKQYADGVGPYKTYIRSDNSFVHDAHQVGLKIHPYTFRPENNFLPQSDQCSHQPSQRCEAGSLKEIQRYLQLGIDGFFADDPKIGRKAVKAFQAS